MDVDVVLNACLETYQEEDRLNSKKAEVVKVRQEEVITKTMTTRLFENGIVIATVAQLTVSQSVTQTPLYEIGGRYPMSMVPGRSTVTGSFIVDLDEQLYRRMNPALRVDRPANYYIESVQVFSDGSSLRFRILDLFLEEAPSMQGGKVYYNYRGSRAEHFTV
jgi:hypothetical protein